MSNSQQMKKGLSVRDLITTGILAALYMVCAMIGEAIFGFFPVLTFLCPLSIALLCGPVYMLILAKVPKHGVFTVAGIVYGALFLAMGCFWFVVLCFVAASVVADAVMWPNSRSVTRMMPSRWRAFPSGTTAPSC